MNFRTDINGLRAIAVIAVIFFHYNPAWVPGGFAGVDVFFVISGYLMTGIIFRGIADTGSGGGHSFRLSKYFVARAKRILPAISAACLALLVFGWFYLIPLDYKELGKHALASITFVSNIVYWTEAGYFDVASHEKWLLHTWSLSVEWQFYIVYPLILVILRKLFSIGTLRLLVIAFAALAFIYGVYSTYQWPEAAYYLLPSRAWEMLVGGIAYLYPLKLSDKNKRYFELTGLALIIGTYFFVSSADLWPGYLAVLPVIGTFLIIQSNRNKSFITGNALFQKIGLWSYSVYIWHWIIVVANTKFELAINPFYYVLITLVLSFISYELFEKRNTKILLGIFSVSLLLSVFVLATAGGASRVDKKFQLDKAKFHELYYGGSGYPSNKFFYTNPAEEGYDFVFVGDSYGLQYAKAIDEKGLKVAALFDHGCLIFPNFSRHLNNKEDVSCSIEYEIMQAELSQNMKPLLMAYSWDTYSKLLVRKGSDVLLDITIDEYQKLILSELEILIYENSPERLYFILGVPQRAKESAYECLASAQLQKSGNDDNRRCNETQQQEKMPINEVLRQWTEQYNNVYFINPNDFLCDAGICLVIKDGEPIHSDQSHLSVYGAPLVIDGMFDYIFNIPKARNSTTY